MLKYFLFVSAIVMFVVQILHAGVEFYDEGDDHLDHLVTTRFQDQKKQINSFKEDSLEPRRFSVEEARSTLMCTSVLSPIPFPIDHGNAVLKLRALIEPEDTLLFVGRTPGILKTFYDEAALKFGPYGQSLRINFSGSPDIVNSRPGLNSLRNVVTRERRDNYCRYLDAVGLRTVQGKLFLVDIQGRGASLNSLLRVLRYYYMQHLESPMPDTNFVAMNWGVGETHGFRRAGDPEDMFLWRGDDGQIRYTPSEAAIEEGYKPLTIDTYPLGMSAENLTLLDAEEFQQTFPPGIEFCAWQWDKVARKRLLTEKGPSHDCAVLPLVKSYVTNKM